jgi:hypothetical protein
MKTKSTLVILFLISLATHSIGQSIVNDYYRVNSGNGNGIKFWSNTDYYKIHMGNTTNNRYGPVTSYSIKMNMTNHASRGWVWGPYNKPPVAALNSEGNLQIKGWMKIDDGTDAKPQAGTGSLEIDGTLRIDGNEIITNTNKILYLNYDNNGDIVFGSNNLRMDASTKRIGIGYSVPASKLEVKGTIRATSATTRNNRIEIGHGGANGFLNMVGVGHLDVRHEGQNVLRIQDNGILVVGSATAPSSDYKLVVEKGIISEKVRVAVKNTADWADYVFDEKFELMSLKDVSDFIEKNKHLPGVPSAEKVVKDGIDMAQMDAVLLKKLEESYLYILDLQDQMDAIKIELKELKNKRDE